MKTKLARIALALLTLNLPLSFAFAQGTMFTYQGRVTDNGTNFTGAGQFKFALVTSTNANHTATATAHAPSDGFVTGYTITFIGNGYVTAPAVTVSGGGGSGATAHAVLSGDAVSDVIADSFGDGNYTNAPTVLIAPPPPDISFTTYWSNDGTSVNGSEPSAAVNVAVSNGVFMVVLGDTTVPNMAGMDASLFTQPNLQLRIWFNDGVNGFAALDPVQNLTPTPYAIFANTASNAVTAATANSATTAGSATTANNFSGSLAGDVTGTQDATVVSQVGGQTAANVAGGASAANGATSAATPGTIVKRDASANFSAGAVTATSFVGNGAGLSSLDASNLTTGTVPAAALGNAWQTGGNAGTTPGAQFLGTADNQPLELRVNGQRALRLEPNTNGAPNVIGGSPVNFVAAGVEGATITGGGTTNYEGVAYPNLELANFGAIGGGFGNAIQSNTDWSAIGGGDENMIQAGAGDSTIGGGGVNTIQSGAVGSTISGGNANTIYSNAVLSTIGGGQYNTIQTNAGASTVSGGLTNTIQMDAGDSTIGGGEGNTIQINAYDSTIGGGYENTIQTNAYDSTIGGGEGNTIQTGALSSTISGGYYNSASNIQATASGGFRNAASGAYSTVPGGYENTASGAYSFAAGADANAVHQGSFVWADSQFGPFSSTTNDQFSVRAQGGIRLAGDVQLGGDSRYHNLSLSGGNSLGFLYGSYHALGDGIHLGYNYYADDSGADHVISSGGATSRLTVGYGEIILAVGGVNTAPNTVMLHVTTGGVCVNGTVNNCSDRNVKQDFAPVSSSQILDEVLRLPVSEWSYKTDPKTRHIGPMAQDFYSSFHIGTDDKHIAPIDEGGVAFAAIQGLNEKVEMGSRKAETQIEELKAENAYLKTRLEKIEALVKSKKGDAQ